MADQRDGGIAWTEETWNPLRGCTRVSAGCVNCYAESMAARFFGTGQPYEGTINPETKRWNGKIKLVPEHLQDPLHWRRSRMVFVNSMSDLFHPDVPDEFIDQVFAVMSIAERHTFQILTKRPERMRAYLMQDHRKEWADYAVSMLGGKNPDALRGAILGGETVLPNVWLGITVENQQAADERIPLLLQTPAAVRWVSMEPLLGPVDLTDEYLTAKLGAYPFKGLPDKYRTKLIDLLDWVVVGGESGRNARPMHPDWARSLRDQCAAAGVPYLFKQWGEWADLTNDKESRAGTRGDYIFTGTGDVLGAGYKSRYGAGGMVEENWRERGGAWMGMVGKKAAGRLLDGVLHNGYAIR